MTDRIITREISAHHAWQGPESEAPAFCNDGPQLAALGAESSMQKMHSAPSGDLISREAAVALVEAECSRILSKQGGKNDAVDMNLRFIALMLPEIAAALRALPAQGQPAAPRPPIQAEGYDVDAMVANLKAHPEWPAMNNAGDVKLYFMNEGDALAMRFAATLDSAE